MSRLLSLAIALLAPFIFGSWLITQGGFSATAETKTVNESVIPDMIEGNADASVTVVEYASFTCPHCASFHAGPYKKLKKNYIDTGKVKFVFREVYFDKVGVWSSLVARCGGQERFFGIADLIFKGQKEWSRAGSDVAVANELRKIGRLAGLDDGTLESCLTDSDKIKALVGWFKENTTRDEISSTPTLLINGEKHANMSYEDLVEIIDAQLAK